MEKMLEIWKGIITKKSQRIEKPMLLSFEKTAY